MPDTCVSYSEILSVGYELDEIVEPVKLMMSAEFLFHLEFFRY